MYPIRVSSLPQLMQCSGSWVLQMMHPEPSDAINQAAADGTAAHEVAAEILRAIASPSGAPRDPMSYVGHVASNGATLDRSLCEAVAAYVEDVTTTIHRLGHANALQVESVIDVIAGTLGGSPDAWHYDGRTITVWDFKTGHDPIEAYENWQLLGYLKGIAQLLKIDGLADQYVHVDLRIVQPRAVHRLGPVRSWQFMLDGARGYFNRIEATCADIMRGESSTKVGPKCLYCSARGNCESLTNAAGAAVEYVGSATSIPFDAASAALELDLLERAIDVAKSRRAGLREVIEHKLRAGEQVAQFVLEPKYGRDGWSVPDDQLFAMGDALGVNLRKVTAITPNQAKAAGMVPDVVDNLKERKPTGFELVRVDQATAHQVFKRSV